MCGIAGIFVKERSVNPQIFLSIVKRMIQSQVHRGPDNIGFFNSENVFLGHCRFSIIDLSDVGNQPMSNENDTIWLVYNGEIYNFRELRGELLVKGHRFKSNTDTEVIIHSYEEWDEDCLEKLEGMFAFALWDEKKSKLFIARDRLGIKPVYYYWDNKTFVFASESKAIINSGLVGKRINDRAVVLYLKFGSIPSPKTIYKNIISLEPAHYLILENQNLKKKRYWDLSDFFKQDRLNFKSEDEVINSLSEKLKNSIKKHLISDVPLGIFLSGGVDSSSIVSLTREISDKTIKTLSVVFPDTKYDESCFAEKIARKFNTGHIEIKTSKDNLKIDIENFFAAIDQPTIDGLNTYLVSRAAKNVGLKVCLSGLGGDELFGGYPSFWQVPKIYNALRIADFVKLPKYLLFLINYFYKNNKTSRLFDMFNPQLSLGNVYLNYRGIFSNEEISQLLGNNLDGENLENFDFIKYLPESFADNSSIKDKISVLEMASYMANQLLKDSDVFGMIHPLEIRVPFLDHKLIEFLARVPAKYKYKKSPNKHFLIKAIGNLPQDVYERPKRGFTLPLDVWMRGELKDSIEKELRNSSIFDGVFVQKLLKDFYDHKVQWSRIWALYILEKSRRAIGN